MQQRGGRDSSDGIVTSLLAGLPWNVGFNAWQEKKLISSRKLHNRSATWETG